MVSEAPDPDDIQGNILSEYPCRWVRHLILEVVSKANARAFLRDAANGGVADVPKISRETHWREQSNYYFNLGLTFEGLRALGTPQESLTTFPTEFAEGMSRRATKLGDFGSSAPENWPAPFDKPERLHAIASLYSEDPSQFDRVQSNIERAFNLLGIREGRSRPGGKVFFGYADDISQPRINGPWDSRTRKDNQRADPLGTVLLGYPTSLEGTVFRVPAPRALGHNGTFNAFRILAQDASGFEAYLDKAADELLSHPDLERLLSPKRDWPNIAIEQSHPRQILREVIAAQMCGRWRDGRPFGAKPDESNSDQTPSNDIVYDGRSRCPAGAHMRRANPRGGHIVDRAANYTRRLVRRGMSYGPEFEPSVRDDHERGLLGNFIGASLGAQFEAIMCDWINLGLHDPDVTGTNDPLIGANTKETSWFDMSLEGGGSIRLRGFPRFVTARGGAYTFLPSLTAIDYLSKLTT